jgi:type II restriction enzyme
VVEGERYSLKTQADARIQRDALYIQKLMEARWIRDFDDPRDLTVRLAGAVRQHLEEYDRILVLRAFPIHNEAVPYELVEVPKSLFERLAFLPDDAFPPKQIRKHRHRRPRSVSS